MIRSNVPLPLLFRLRLRANWVARRAQSRLYSTYRQRGGSDLSKAVWVKNAARRGLADCSPQLWTEFVDQYEQFTAVLCSAARNGCTPGTEREYAAVRKWFTSRYAAVAHRVRPYLDVEFACDDPCPTRASRIADYAGHRRQIDVLESLFQAASLHDLLHGDCGDLIPRVERVSNAVYRCHASLPSSTAATARRSYGAI